MYDIDMIHNYNKNYVGDRPFLSALNEDWSFEKPLNNLRILHNVFLTKETMLKLESLLLSGADLTVTHTKVPGVEPNAECMDVLKNAGVRLISEHDDIKGEFDFGLDCCAQIPYMKNVKITEGCVELTQSGTEIYRKIHLDVPAISVDDSHLKCLEGMFGTGEAFLRAFKQMATCDIQDKKFVVFGYGKVGRGIVKYLLRETRKILVVDPDKSRKRGIEALGLRHISPDEKERLGTHLKSAFAIISATGKPGVISEHITENELSESVWLANMGVDDEFGDGFSTERVVGNKAPINFNLESPTMIHYIDPIFWAHNICCEYMLNNKLEGYNPLPKELDDVNVKKWESIYHEDCSAIFT